MERTRWVGVWLAALISAATFVMAGISKLAGAPQMVEEFHRFGYPDWFRVLIGAAEVGGAIALLVPRTAILASMMLGVIMAGAVTTHLRFGETLPAMVPLVLFVLVAAVGYARRPRWLITGWRRQAEPRPVR
jgi:putative oxidoreductase